MYLHYVDDIFAVFDNDDKCKSFSNNQRKNLQFTLEKSTNTSHFLYVDIKINEHGVELGFGVNQLVLVYF